jgi:hypothetical protein
VSARAQAARSVQTGILASSRNRRILWTGRVLFVGYTVFFVGLGSFLTWFWFDTTE